MYESFHGFMPTSRSPSLSGIYPPPSPLSSSVSFSAFLSSTCRHNPIELKEEEEEDDERKRLEIVLGITTWGV
jgi:hypothetical protein